MQKFGKQLRAVAHNLQIWHGRNRIYEFPGVDPELAKAHRALIAAAEAIEAHETPAMKYARLKKKK